MSNNIVNYGKMEFDDHNTISETITLNNSLIFDDLVDDEAEIDVLSDYLGERLLLTSEEDVYCTSGSERFVIDPGDIRKFSVGDTAEFHLGDIKYKFFIQKVSRLSFGGQSLKQWRLTFSSVVGILDKRRHYGGIYDGDLAGDIIEDIFGDLDVEVEEDVAEVPVYGYLPIASARENLQQVLFVLGAVLVQDEDGVPTVKFLADLQPISITDDRICIDESTTYDTKATKIVLTEHAYYESALDQQVSLFDNTDEGRPADNKTVEFSNPCHGLVANGLTIEESGVNYAIVSGTGTLTGYEYTHTQKLIEQNTGESGPEKIITVKDATLVNALNSANVSGRIADYFRASEYDNIRVVMGTDDIRPGALLQYNDPDGELTAGIVSDATIVTSETNIASCKVIKGYTPQDFGNNYENVDVVSTSGTWSVPAGVDRIRIVLIGGGQAGYAGQNGNSGSNGKGGAGGSGGNGGHGGSIWLTDIDNPSGSYTVTIGSGGASAGAYGNATTAVHGGTTYSSANGAPSPTGYRELLTNVIYAVKGTNGANGEKGGNGGTSSHLSGYRGSDFNTTYRGGAPGSGYTGSVVNGYACGGGGGGACYGQWGDSGEDGTPAGTQGATANYGGAGGEGGTASNYPSADVTFGSGGQGGNGGGGGGGGGYYKSVFTGTTYSGYATDGSGGSGSSGNAGGQGVALFYY